MSRPEFRVPIPDEFGFLREVQATYWAQAAPGTTYWRCEIPARHLPGIVLQLTPKDLQKQAGKIYFPRQKGAAIWQFPGNTARAIVMAGMQQEGIPVFVEVDDNYLIDFPMAGYTKWKAKIDPKNLDQHSREAHRRIIPWVDGVLCATEALVRSYRGGNKNVFHCPNSIDEDDWPEPEKPDDGIFRIGYAASDSHIFDIRLIVDAFDWAARQPDVEVVLFGLRPDDSGSWGRIPARFVPWTETLSDYRASLSLLDVGVCPLKETAWSACKSDVKAMEYAMAGALPVVQKAEPYRPWFDQSCLVAEHDKDWLRHIKWCVKNRDEVKRLAAEAKTYVLVERTIRDNLWRWEEALACAPVAGRT